MPDLRVAFAPFFGANPYQPELARELRALGVTVTERANVRGLVRARLLGGERLDVLHLHWLPPARRGWRTRVRLARFLAIVRTLRRLGVRVVWTVHNLVSHDSEAPEVELGLLRAVARLAHRIVVHGPSAREALADLAGPATAAKVVVIEHGNYVEVYPSGVGREDARRRLGLPADVRVLLFLGLVRRYKGVDLLLDAFARLETDARLVVAGAPSDEGLEAELRALVPDDGSVTFLPASVPDDELQVHFAAADAVVFPYRRVLTSGAVVLAMSFGRACVAPRLGCIPDVLDDEGAVLYDPSDEDGLRAALERATDASVDLEAMGRRNFERACDWSWDRVAARTLAVYEDALREGS